MHYYVRGPVHGEVGCVDGPQWFAEDKVGPADVVRDHLRHVQRDGLLAGVRILRIEAVPHDDPNEPDRTEPVETRLPFQMRTEN